MKKSLCLAVLASLVFLLIGCGMPIGPSQDELQGSLRLLVNKGAVSKTIEPEVDMEVETFHIALTGPGSPIGQTVGGDESSVLIPSLVAGDWTVTVEAANAVPEVIGRGSHVVRVLAGQTATAMITVVPLTGAGPLQLTMSWPAAVVPSASVRVILYDAADTPHDISASFSTGVVGDRVVAGYHGEWEAGYYLLTLQLLDDASAVVWGTVEAVRILAGAVPAVGVFTLSGTQMNLRGEVEMEIETDLQNAIEVMLSGVDPAIAVGSEMTVTAHPNQTAVSYQWYLNGSLLPGETNQDITLGSGLPAGNYQLSGMVRTSVAMGSASAAFSVVPEELIWVGDFWIEDEWDLAGYTHVTGSLYVENTELTYLGWLGSLTSIGENLSIRGNAGLTDLTGFGGLTSVGGDLGITGNSDWDTNRALASLTGLESLTSIGGSLEISGNDTLTSSGDVGLTDLTGLEGLTSIGGSLRIRYALKSLTGLENLRSIGGHLVTSGHMSHPLSNLAGLDGLESIGGDLYISEYELLTSLAGLENLSSIGGSLRIFQCRSLTSLSALSSLTSVGADITIIEAYTLTSLAGLEGLVSIAGDLRLFLCSSLTDLTALEGLVSIAGDLSLNTLSLTDLTSLEALTFVGGTIRISFIHRLLNLAGLEGLTSIPGDLVIAHNRSLTSLVGLENLTSIGEDLAIQDNSNLATSGAEELAGRVEVGGTITIEGNAP